MFWSTNINSAHGNYRNDLRVTQLVHIVLHLELEWKEVSHPPSLFLLDE